MRLSILLMAVISFAIMAMVLAEAAGEQEDQKKTDIGDQKKKKTSTKKMKASHRTHKNQKNKNPHALSASEERFSTCGGRSDVFRVSQITSNRHLCSGCKACIDVEGLLQGRIDRGSKVRLQVSKFFFTVYDKTFDLCSVLENVKDGPRCPIEPTADGLRACLPLDHSLTTDITAGIKVSAVDASSRPLFCIQGSAMIESRCPSDVGPGSYACNN